MSEPSTPPSAASLADRHRAAFEQSPLSTIVYDPAGRALRVNAAFERLWGVSLRDLPPDYCVLRDPQLAEAGVLPALRRAFEGVGQAVTLPALRYDVAALAGSGHTRWTQATLYPVRGDDGALQEVVLAHRDVTAEMEAEERLREANARLSDANEELLAQAAELEATLAGLRAGEARYRALVEASTRMVWLTSAEGLVHDMPFWRDLTGQSVDEVRGAGWLDAVHPDDRGRTVAAWRRAVDTRGAYDTEYRLRLRSGVYRRYRSRGVPVVGDDGAVREWVGVLEEVDLGAERARRLLAAARGLGDALDADAVARVIFRESLDALDADAGSLALVHHDAAGVPREFEVVRVTGFPDDTIQRWRRFPLRPGRPLTDATLTGQVVVIASREGWTGPYAELAPEVLGTGYQALVAVPVCVGGVVTAAITLLFREPQAVDAATRTFLESLGELCAQALARTRLLDAERGAREEATRANEAKTQFLRTMSHELRTPLGVIGGIVELWELGLRGPLTDLQRADLGRVKRNQRYLLGLITDVLNLAKIEAGQVAFDLRPVPAAAVLEAVCELTVAQAEQRGVRLTVAPSPPELAAVADGERLQQVLVNLVANALKATPAGGEVALAAAAADATVRFTVRDTGVGVPPDKLEAIFAPFVQLGRSLTSGHEGTGLGLSISRDLARAMGGDLTAASEPGAGATFTVALPRA